MPRKIQVTFSLLPRGKDRNFLTCMPRTFARGDLVKSRGLLAGITLKRDENTDYGQNMSRKDICHIDNNCLPLRDLFDFIVFCTNLCYQFQSRNQYTRDQRKGPVLAGRRMEGNGAFVGQLALRFSGGRGASSIFDVSRRTGVSLPKYPGTQTDSILDDFWGGVSHSPSRTSKCRNDSN